MNRIYMKNKGAKCRVSINRNKFAYLVPLFLEKVVLFMWALGHRYEERPKTPFKQSKSAKKGYQNEEEVDIDRVGKRG